MKLFNPFKWHVVKFRNDFYAVRRWSLFWWEYADARDFEFTWSGIRYALKYAMFRDSNKAIEVAEMRSMRIERIIWP